MSEKSVALANEAAAASAVAGAGAGSAGVNSPAAAAVSGGGSSSSGAVDSAGAGAAAGGSSQGGEAGGKKAKGTPMRYVCEIAKTGRAMCRRWVLERVGVAAVWFGGRS